MGHALNPWSPWPCMLWPRGSIASSPSRGKMAGSAPSSPGTRRWGCGCQNRFGIPFWLAGEFTTHFRTYFRGDWDVYWPLTHGHGEWESGRCAIHLPRHFLDVSVRRMGTAWWKVDTAVDNLGLRLPTGSTQQGELAVGSPAGALQQLWAASHPR